MSEMLEKARNYEAEKLAGTDPATRPLFHIAAPAGWINDPNGFLYTMEGFICFISIIRMPESGDRCIGDTVCQRI